MPNQDDDPSPVAFAKAALRAPEDMISSAARGAQRAAKAAFGLAPAPGEDNDAYARQYNTD